MKTLIWIYHLIFIPFLFSCSDNAVVLNKDIEMQAIGVIIDAGPIETDGCGWCMLIDNQYCHLSNLPSEYQINGLEVLIRYSILSEPFYCGLAATPYKNLKIKDIFRTTPACATIEKGGALSAYTSDMYSLNDWTIFDDCLKINISYSGGCKKHFFYLVQDDSCISRTFHLLHNSGNDLCKAYISEFIGFNLSEIQHPDSNSVGFFLQAPNFKKYIRYHY
ncbi:hypothetical protein ACFLRI_02740 [Bacteroidota bacterium]